MSLDAELAKLNEIVGRMALPFDGKSVEVEGDGTLILKGILATCDVDRQGEKFDESSLRSAFQRYYERSPLVVLNHKLSQGIGKLIDATFNKRGQIEVEAEIYKPPAGDPTEGAYNLIRNGVLRALSIGGRWRKVPLPNGVTKLYVSEIVESSVATGIGANADALFEVVGQKSFGSLDDELERLAALDTNTLDDDLAALRGLV